MRKNNFLSMSILGMTLLLSDGIKADVSVIKKGLNSLTTDAVQGPSIQCEEKFQAPLSAAFKANGANCSAFIKADGSLGKLGSVITSHISSMGDDTLFHSENLSGVKTLCPKWSTFNKEQRDYFWVWLFASISWKESTCGADTVNRAATHGTAVGQLQLNKFKKDRSWRGGESGNSCAVKNIAPAEASMKCGIEILHEQLKGKDGLYLGDGNLFGKKANSYWHHLRLKSGGKIIQLMRGFPGCR